MFGKDLNKVGEILVAEKYFALAVLYVVLQVVGDGLCGAEIFHGVRDVFAKLFGETEEVIDGIFAVEDDGSVVAEVNARFAEFGDGESDDFEKFIEGDVDTVFCD